jgi:HSP20 family protein
MDRLAQSVFGGLTGDGAWLPAADVVETDSAYVIEVELPGVRREDVDVNLNGDELVVTGEVKERKREGLFRRRTRRVGEFELRVTLPGYRRDGDIEASLAYGVLTVYVPKAESTKSRVQESPRPCRGVQVEPGIDLAQVVAGELSDARQPVAQRAAMDVQCSRGFVIISSALQVIAQGHHQFGVLAVVVI